MNDIAKKIFPEEAARVEAGHCAMNAEHVIGGFRDALSEKEYRISGMCQKCQDEFFRK